MYFEYGKKEIDYLRSRDKKLAAVIDRVGLIEREVDTDLFSAVVHHIVGQQISMKAQATVWQRMRDALGEVDADSIISAGEDRLQSCGMTFRKAEYLKDFALKVKSGRFDPEALREKSDEDVIKELSSLKGVGVWTAEMIMLFCMQRANVFSYGDLAILRGLRMLYRHRNIDRKLFEKYRKRFSPYCSVASLYLWAVAGGALPELTDPAPALQAKKKKQAKTDKSARSAEEYPPGKTENTNVKNRKEETPMEYTHHYDSPLGGITMASDGESLTGLWFDGQKYFADTLGQDHEERGLPVFEQADRWLDTYFSGREPDLTPPLHMKTTEFRKAVWDIMLTIPYGSTMTYGEIAKRVAEEKGLKHMSAQAVGGAVGHNSISLMIPCHRVVGSDGSLTGYAGGIDRKIKLLELEHADMTGLHIPKKGTAL